MLRLYVERFNARDWDGVRALIADDARLRVADRYAGPIDGSPYFGNYARVAPAMAAGDRRAGRRPAIVVLHVRDGEWVPHTCVNFEIVDGRVTRIADYGHTPWLVDAARSIVIL